jgi:hypothetical protein
MKLYLNIIPLKVISIGSYTLLHTSLQALRQPPEDILRVLEMCICTFACSCGRMMCAVTVLLICVLILSPKIVLFREKVCCGTIFKGPYGAVIVDPRFLKPCRGCKNQQQEKATVTSAGQGPGTGDGAAGGREDSSSGMKGSKLAKSYSDSSSDSGYDESSNQGVGEGGHHRSNAASRRSAGRAETSMVASNPLEEFAIHAANRCQQEVGERPN